MPFPTSPMSFQLDVFRGGQTEGLGQGGCSGGSVWGLGRRMTAWTTVKPVREQASRAAAAPQAGGLRNPFGGMKDLKRAGNLFLPMRPPESLHFQKRVHFISLQESGLWVSNMRRK